MLETVEGEHELMVTVVVIMCGDVVAVGADEVCKLLRTDGMKSDSRSSNF